MQCGSLMHVVAGRCLSLHEASCWPAPQSCEWQSATARRTELASALQEMRPGDIEYRVYRGSA